MLDADVAIRDRFPWGYRGKRLARGLDLLARTPLRDLPAIRLDFP
jgi:hypothetical protein